MPAVFAFADQVIGNPQTTIFAAFGSFAMLVLADFSGPLRTRVAAYVLLGCVGAINIVIGTLCSRNPWVAAAAMAVVGFAILFSGVINGYFAAAATAVMLTFVLPVSIPAPMADVPARLEGWALAVVAGILAHLLFWSPSSGAALRDDAARACRALADLADPEISRDPSAAGARDAAAALRKRFLATPHRTTGPTGPTAALASLVDELDWLLTFLVPQGGSSALCQHENAEAMAAIAAVLRASAAHLDGGEEELDLHRLEAAREAVIDALVRGIQELPRLPDEGELVARLEPAFRARAGSYSVRRIADYAVLAGARSGRVRRPAAAIQVTGQIAAAHAGIRSVWFRNSVRGAVGLALAVFISQRAGLQHSFWVVLGTLSVLRSNALSTGWSILSALAGTAAGIVVGSIIVIAIGTHHSVLWAVLPFAVLLAAYAPRAISFAAGQAGFTVVIFVLFNLIQPTGWQVGLVRIEDVAIGFGISLGVGLLFWPRGASKLLRENLASAYARSADYVVATAHELVAGGVARASDGAQSASAAVHDLEDAFRQYLSERSTHGLDVESVGMLVAGAARVRHTGESLAALLGSSTDGNAPLPRCGAYVSAEASAVHDWYVAFGDALERDATAPPARALDADARKRFLACVHDAVAGGDATKVRPALNFLWASEHLDNLWRLETHLGRAVSSG